MTPTLETSQTPTVDSEIRPHRFTGAEFRRMYESGLVPRRSQLIRGEIYFMAAMGAAHTDALRILNKLLLRAYGDVTAITQQSPVAIWDDSEPEPDFALLKPDYPGGIPKAKDVLLVIEISDSTLKFDREKKLPDYARSGIPEAWILNLNDHQLEVYRQPDGEQYLQVQIVKPETTFAPLFAPDVKLEWRRALQKIETKADGQ